jgi:hypothetical protein
MKALQVIVIGSLSTRVSENRFIGSKSAQKQDEVIEFN